MTITPTAPTLGPAPAVSPMGDAGTAPDGTVPGDFLALVQKALADALGGAPDSASGTPAVGTPPGPGSPGTPDGVGVATDQAGVAPTGPTGDTPAEAPADAQADPTAAATAAAAAAAAGLTALVVPVLPAPPAGAGATPATTATAGPTAGPIGAVGGTATTGSSAATGAPVAAATSDAAGSATRAPGHPGTDSSAASADTGGSVDGVTDAPVTAAGTSHGSRGSGDAADPGAARQSAVPASSGVAPTAVAGAPVSTPGVSAPAATALPPVSGQVFPEVTSLVSRGEGVHRITLTLKPEALGEVRVVMTVRDGAVHVRLAAGHEAQQALLQGSPELSRLLEHAGATDTHIVVRDLFAATAPTTSTSTTDHGTDLGQGQGLDAGSSRSQDQHAGTRAEHDATDGTVTSGATSPRSAQSVTHTRTSGVDVTM